MYLIDFQFDTFALQNRQATRPASFMPSVKRLCSEDEPSFAETGRFRILCIFEAFNSMNPVRKSFLLQGKRPQSLGLLRGKSSRGLIQDNIPTWEG